MAHTRVFGIVTAAACAVTLIASSAYACSRMAWTTKSHGVFAARSMDWAHSFDDVLFINPRGREMDGGAATNAAVWTTKYGSVVASIYPYAEKHGFGREDGATDGINEEGLTAHLLYLEETQYAEPNDVPGVTYMRWVRYILDNFATVSEAVEGMKQLRIEGVALGGEILGTHMAIEDPTGDSAIFEILDGELVVHHGPAFNIMTNDPPYDWQITHLEQYQGFGGQREIRGGIEGADRFVRLAHFTKHLPEPQNSDQAAGYALSAIHGVAVPFGAPYYGLGGEIGTYPTWWTSVTDIKNRLYYFNWAKAANIVWVDLTELDFSEGSGKRVIDPKIPALVGNISGSFEPLQD